MNGLASNMANMPEARRARCRISPPRSKSVDDLLDSARELVRKSPGVAIGAAAAVGFVVARLLTAGLDQRDRD